VQQRLAKMLIDAGANVNGQGYRGFTPLHWACILRFNDIIELLLAKGANPHIENAFGRKPLEYYISDIAAEDISFSLSCAQIPGQNIEMDDIAYNSKDVIFVSAQETSDRHKEPSKHNFSTKMSDYSDLYWHIDGILNNLGLNHNIVISSKMNEAEKFNLRAATFIEIRSEYPVKEELIEQMKKSKEEVVPISIFNNTNVVPVVENCNITSEPSTPSCQINKSEKDV
jgi:hypothetical protein